MHQLYRIDVIIFLNAYAFMKVIQACILFSHFELQLPKNMRKPGAKDHHPRFQ